MPVNPSIYYVKAEQEFHEAETTQQKIKALKKMLATAPTHKGAEKLRKQIKTRLAKLKYKGEKEAQIKKGGYSLSIRKEGAAQIAFVGLPNVGKSYVLEKLSSAPVEQENYPFTTKKPEIRMIDLDGAKLQGVEIPAIYRGAYEKDNGPELFSLIRNADFVVLVIDGRKQVEEQVTELCDELASAEIELTRKRKGHIRGQGALMSRELRSHEKEFTAYIPALILINKEPFFSSGVKNLDVLNFKENKIKSLIEEIWAHLGLIRIYTRAAGKVAKKPVVMKKKSTVGDVARKVHKDFIKNFKYAKIWGSGVFPGQQVGTDYILKDRDVVEIYTN